MLKNLIKAAVGIVTLPIDIVADFVTLGGSITDQNKPYTAQKLERMKENIDKALDAEEDSDER